MPEPSSAPNLGNKIARLLKNGIVLKEDVVEYIDSTFSNPDIEEFRRILSDPENCEAESVIELIFYPDSYFQENLEPVLMADCLSESDIEAAIGNLADKKIDVAVMFPDGRGRCDIRLTDAVLRQVMARLNVRKSIDVRLDKTLSRCIGEMTDQLRLRVLIRNCRISFSGSAGEFLCQCIEKMYAVSPRFWEAVAFLLDFFETGKPNGDDIYDKLMGEKKKILRSIDQAEKNENALKHHSVEALMLKGMNILAVDIPEARRRTVLIDHICISVFNKTELFGFPDQVQTRINPMDFIPPESET